MEEVPVQVGELLSRAHLFEVVWRDDQEVTESMKRIEELEHQRNLWSFDAVVSITIWCTDVENKNGKIYLKQHYATLAVPPCGCSMHLPGTIVVKKLCCAFLVVHMLAILTEPR